VTVATTWPGRATWVGSLKFGLVTVPVKAYPAVCAREEAELHQVHASCGQRIHHQKCCAVHGPVDAQDIVKGFEYAPGQFVTLDAGELEQLRSGSDHTIAIEHFAPAGQIDPALFAGRSFYLVPDGSAGLRPYSVLSEALRIRRTWAVGRAGMSGRCHLVLLRLAEHLLAMDLLHYPGQLQDLNKADRTSVRIAAEEIALATQLVDSACRAIRGSDFRDDTAERFRTLIDAKIHGQLEEVPAPEAIPVLSLEEALRQSLNQSRPNNSPASRRFRKKSASPPA